jgi:hypothetical protein
LRRRHSCTKTLDGVNSIRRGANTRTRKENGRLKSVVSFLHNSS